MDIEGTYTLQAPVEEVCQCLMDLQTLRHAMPGLERLEHTGQLVYSFTLRIKQAPLRGVYQGKVMVHSAPYPDSLTSYRFSIEEDGQHNPFQGIWDIRLSQQNDNTVVVYSGTLNLGRMSALLPPSLVKGAVKILIQQFFANLAEQLRTTTEPLYLVPGFDASEVQEGDSEEQWVTRLKRFGAFSVLLLLVWIGTRLPRRLFPRD